MDTRRRVKTHTADQFGGKHEDIVQEANLHQYLFLQCSLTVVWNEIKIVNWRNWAGLKRKIIFPHLKKKNSWLREKL